MVDPACREVVRARPGMVDARSSDRGMDAWARTGGQGAMIDGFIGPLG